MVRSSKTLNNDSGSQYVRIQERFDSSRTAASYPAQFGETRRDRLERNAILKALTHVVPGSKVLDLPCGTGRLTSLLVSRGYHVTGADASPLMVDQATHNWTTIRGRYSEQLQSVEFEVRDAIHTGYNDGEFDAVVCNRLFHDFTEPDVRIAALCEMRRIVTGAVIVSFFNAFALDAAKFHFKMLLEQRKPKDRIPISMGRFRSEIELAGFSVVDTVAKSWGISPLWYVVLRPSVFIQSRKSA